MLGTFTYHNPTKLHFGNDSLSFLPEELAQFGPNVVLAYGGGSIKRNGVYDQVIGILHDAGKSVTEIAGVMPNPAEKLKIGHVFASSGVMPRFSILNPEFTLSLPHRQVMAGVYDTFNHICEQYFSGTDDNVSDYLSEGLMRSVIESGLIAAENDQDYEARSNIMWAATWALNTLVSRGKSTDWMVHMLGQAVGAVTNETHGMTLAAVSLPYYRYIMDAGLPKFVRFATNVWDVDPAGKSDEQIAEEGLAALEAWMKKLELPLNLNELGAGDADLDDLVNATIILEGGYKTFTEEDVRTVLKQCF